MSFSELLFTFQPFPRPRFRMIVCPIIPFALPRATRTLTRPVAHTFAQSIARMLATLVFRFLVSAYLINTRATRSYRVHISPASSRVIRTFIAMFSYGLENNMGVLPFNY